MLSSIEWVAGGGRGDTISGTEGPDILVSSLLSDAIIFSSARVAPTLERLIGRGGDDRLVGRFEGSTSMSGGAGDDSIISFSSRDDVRCGPGADVVRPGLERDGGIAVAADCERVATLGESPSRMGG